MPSFQVPDGRSSSPPSTPDRRSHNRFGFSGPSTTPAGAPPSSARSFTPQGAPQSDFGSSQLDFTYDKEPARQLFPSASSSIQHGRNNSAGAYGSLFAHAPQKSSGLSNEFKAPDYGDEDMDDSYDEDEENQAEGQGQGRGEPAFQFERFGGRESLYDIGRMVDELGQSGYEGRPNEADDEMDGFGFDQTLPGFASAATFGQHDYRSQQPIQRRVEDDRMDFRQTMNEPAEDFNGQYEFSRDAKDMCKQLGLAQVDEDDDFIMRTESLIHQMYREGLKMNDDEEARMEVLRYIPSQLSSMWEEYDKKTRTGEEYENAGAIGPKSGSTDFANANFLASLLVGLHHPSHLTDTKSLRQTQRRGPLATALAGKPKPTSLGLLEWMDKYHDPYPEELDEVLATRPSPSSNKMYWANVKTALLRGRVDGVIAALQNAGWEYAANTDRAGGTGYYGQALSNVERVVGDMINTLRQMPAFTRRDWETMSSDWTIFRLRVSQGMNDLKRFAEGKQLYPEQRTGFEKPSTYGMLPNYPKAKPYSELAQRAESLVPWDVYQNLLAMYNLMLGDLSSIIASSFDWVEATIGLTVWWNHGKQDRRHMPSMTLTRREEPKFDNYLTLLAESFHIVIKSKDFSGVNTMKPTEVGLASIFEGDIDGAIGIIRSYSAPISVALVELASIAGWLPKSASTNGVDVAEDLDQDDLDLLGVEQPKRLTGSIKDTTLISYAEQLADIKKFEWSPERGGPTVVREGWQVAMEVLARLDPVERSEKEVGLLINDLNLDDGETVEKIWRQLNELAMSEHAETVAERYAVSLSEQTHKYGEALWYFALGHKQDKVKEVLDLLISLSLLHSVAYPVEAELDDHLKRLLKSPKAVLNELSQLDYKATTLLQQMLSGYATLRRFYDLRDSNVTSEIQKPLSQPAKAEAVSALIAVINSSDDNIRGGLYDEERGAVVDVDFLLPLLGEAMVFVGQQHVILNAYQIEIILKSIEDLETVGERVYSACDEFFKTVVASKQGLKSSTPADLFRKSSSGLSGASSFSMVGSSMMASQFQKSLGSSGVLIKENTKRGWDWRKGLTAAMTSKDVLRVLRYGLARDLAKTWVLQADGQL